MNARQAAEYRDELARKGIAQQEREETLRRAAIAASTATRVRHRKPKAARSPTRAQQERELAARLLPHISEFSTIRRDWQAADVARLIVQGRLKTVAPRDKAAA